VKEDPTITKYHEFYRLQKFIKPTKKDVFYDLGCGDGNTCRWISKKIKKSIGIEKNKNNYKEAVSLNSKRNYLNVEIKNEDFSNTDYSDATIIYSTDINEEDFIRIQKITEDNTIVIYPSFPPYPLMSIRQGGFFILQTPFGRVKDENEYARIYMGGKRDTIKTMFEYIDKSQKKQLEGYIKNGERFWRKIAKL